MAGIICPQCNAANKESARYCAECGAELGTARSSRPVAPQTGDSITTKAPLDQNRVTAPVADSARVLQNRYRIDDELGRGGFGAVYRAWDVNLSKPCAVKENLTTTPEAQRQFTREAKLLSNLSHPNLPRVTDYFILPDEGQYLVMDFVEGEDLLSIMSKKEVIPVDQAVDWAMQVCSALDYLHNQNPAILHRDIKPANIRITSRGRAVLVDFGLVKVFDQHLKTTVGARAITPGYAPPEQYGQGKTDERTDIYALGATLYDLVTGHEPLESVARMAGEHLETASRLNPAVPLVVSDVIERAMALEPAMRYQTAGEFWSALKAARTIAARAPEGKNLVTMLVEPEGDAQPTLAPAMSAPAAGVEEIARPVSKPPSGPIPARREDSRPVAAGAGQAAAKTKKRWLMLGIGGVALVALCLGGAALLGGLFMQGGGGSQSATLTYDASLKDSVQATTTKLAALHAATIKTSTVGKVENTPTATTKVLQPTATLRSKSTATGDTKAQATQRALESYLNNLQAGAGLVYGPKSGRIPHKAENSYIETISASVGLRSFILEVTFIVPYSSAEAPWDFGIVFREASPNVEYRLLFNSDKSWIFSLHAGSPDGKDLLDGTIDGLNTAEGSPNKIRIYAVGDQGWFFVNDQFISELDLSKQYSGRDHGRDRVP